jgi:sortase A
MKRRIFKDGWSVLAALFLFAGALFLAYPYVAKVINNQNESKAIAEYTQNQESLSDIQRDELFQEAQEYNASLLSNSNPFELSDEETEELHSLLVLGDEQTIASLEIPSISLNLPIYHGLSETVLQQGIGHMDGSSLPVGGDSTHCILAGHRGSPSAVLFSNLDEVEEGDVFYIHVLGQTLRYVVDSISVVEPENVTGLSIHQGEDRVTLVTCTPYGINSERLLVSGIRSELSDTSQEEIESRIDSPFTGSEALILAFVALAILVWGIFRALHKKGQKNS